MNAWRLTAYVTAALVALPLLSLLVLALSGDFSSLAHVAKFVLPRVTLTTFTLLVGVAIGVAVIGTITAYLTAFFEFPGRRLLSWLLLLPLAVPSYIAAYGFVEYFSFTGPLQELVRELGGFTSKRQYWFPNIRSTGGAILILSLILYPYVYLSVRASFALQGRRMLEAARLTGAAPLAIFWHVALPLARPAIALGVTLALMETLNDIGAVEFLGVETLTFAVFSVWLNQGNVAGAAQLSLVLLLFVLVLILIERRARQRGSASQQRVEGRRRHRMQERLNSRFALAFTFFCALPILGGFLLPIWVLMGYATRRLQQLHDPELWTAALTTVTLAGIAAFIAAVLAVLLTYALRATPSRGLSVATRIAASGYAVPGTIIALGLFIPLAKIDNLFAGAMRDWFGVASGLLLTGTGFALIYAYVVRFLAIAEGNLASGFGRIGVSVDSAAHVLGSGRGRTLTTVLLPLLRPAIGAAALLVFIDVTKELSATILLRPFGISTLSTHVYEWASMGRVEDGAIACLLMVTVAILPIALLLRRAVD